MRLAGQHAIVTGGGTGIGAAIADALEAEGARVSRLGRRLEKLGPTGVAADVTDRNQVDAAFATARDRHGPISILVNNAGTADGTKFGRVSDALWRETLAVNLDGVFHCCQAALADLLAARAGRIVTIASMAGLIGYSYASPYIAAKHGAVGLMRALAAEFGKTGLTANAVCPGFVDTEILAHAVSGERARSGCTEEEARTRFANLNPSRRLIAPEEVATATLALILSTRNGEAVEIA